MAETYGVYDWRQLELVTAATLVQGLPTNSRVHNALTGTKSADEKTLLLAIIADQLGHIAWMISPDGQNGRNHPKSILAVVTGESGSDECQGFASEEDFAAAWAAITGGDADA